MKKLLIGYDGSACADAALEDLTGAGLPAELEVQVLSVADVWLPPDAKHPGAEDTERLPQPVQKAREAAWQAQGLAHDRAEHGRARLHSLFPKWEINPEDVADAPAWAIIKKAAEWGADLVVVGSHGYSAIRRFLLGSVSQKVAAVAGCSVRIARPHPHAGPSGLRITVAVDGSQNSEAVLRAVLARAWPATTGFQIIALSSPHPAIAATPLGHGRQIFDDEWLWQTVERLAGAFRNTYPAVETCWLRGRIDHLLLDHVEKWEVDCLFVDAHALEHNTRHVLGSLASAVVNRAHCSIEIVREQPMRCHRTAEPTKERNDHAG